MTVISQWFQKVFSDPQAVILAVLLALGFAVVLIFGDMLIPVIASLVIAYLLEGVVAMLERCKTPRLVSVMIVFSIFILFLLILLFGLLPLLSQQLTQLFQELPAMISSGQDTLMLLPEKYPQYFTQEQVNEIMASLRQEVASMGQNIVTFSLKSIPGLVTLVVYLILAPLLVFFLLKDKRQILDWLEAYMPRDRKLAENVWKEVDEQMANYVRGKFWEMLVVGVATYGVFEYMGLQYAVLLGVFVGLSVLVPYVGAAVVTIPVAVVAFSQWGWTSEFFYLMIAYGIVQALDGNVLVPLLFSEAVSIHPIAIIIAVLFFGGLWGVWGVFFAIPLAALVKAVLTAWPRASEETVAESS